MTARGDGRVDPAGLRELRHELRTPINHIMGYSELLLEEAEETGLGGLVPDLEAVHAAGKRALGLINSALDSARLGENSISLVSLRGELQAPLDAIIAS